MAILNQEEKNKRGDFKTGDQVRLKSGGPDMTVSEIASTAGIRCHWFGGKKLEHGFFQADELVKIEPGDKGGG
jgi:uncharacterized protein YodC (DUF2158 family)